MADATPVPTVSDFDFIMSTILRQGNDSPLRKALLKAGVLDLGNLMCLNDREIGRLKFPDDSSGTIVLEDLSVGHQGLIRCFKAFARKKSAEGNPMHSDWQNLADLDEFREYQIAGYDDTVPYSDRIDEYDDTMPYSKQDNDMPSSNLSIAMPTPAVAPGGTASFPPRTRDAVADFQKGIKRDPASFTIMKENKQQDHGVTPVAMIPSEPSRLVSRPSFSAGDLSDPIPNDPEATTVDPLDHGENLPEDARDNQVVNPREPSRLGSRQPSSAGDSRLGSRPPSSVVDCRLSSNEPSVANPSEPSRLSSCLAASVVDCRVLAFVVGLDVVTDDASIPSEPPEADQVKPSDSRPSTSSVVDCRAVLDNDNGIAVLVVAANPIPTEPPEIDIIVADDSILSDPEADQVKPSDSRPSTSSVVDCRAVLDNDNGIAVLVVAADPIPTDPEEATDDPIPTEPPDRLGSRQSFSADDIFMDDPIPSDPEVAVDPLDGGNLPHASGRVNPSEPSRLESRLPALADDGFKDDVGIVSIPNDAVTDDSIPSEPPDGLDCCVSSSDNDIFLDDHDVVVTDDPIPTEPPDGPGYRLSSCDNSWGAVHDGRHKDYNIVDLDDHAVVVTDDPIPTEPPDGLGYRLSSCDNSWGAVHDGHHKDYSYIIVDHRPVMIDHRMIRGAVTTTGMRRIGTLTYEERCVSLTCVTCDS
jgi:hypothetical protein